MLCYRSSRDATDVVHDTFYWLALNNRIFAALMLPLLTTCIVAITLMRFNFDDTDSRLSWLEVFWMQLMPLGFGNDETQAFAEQSAFGYCLMAFMTTLFLVPLLRHYFVERRSLQHITLQQALSLLRQHFQKAIATASITALMCFVLIYIHYIFIPMLFVAVWQASIIMSDGQPIQRIKKRWWTTIKSLFFIVLTFCIINSLPFFLIGIVQHIITLIARVTPSMKDFAHFDNPFFVAIMETVSCISFCAALIVFHLGILMLHGAMYEKKS